MDARGFDATTDPALRSWVPAGDPDFPIQNLPFGAFVRAGDPVPRLAVAIGDYALDLHVLAHAGAFDASAPEARTILAAPSLDGLLARGRTTWRAVRSAISRYLRADADVDSDAFGSGNRAVAARALVRRDAVHNVLPFKVGAYVDFYASLEHASNLGAILRPGDEPLPPNWRWLPLGYHGRASTVTCEAAIRRPHGAIAGREGVPQYGLTRKLDYELELACVTGDGPADARALATETARESIFGVALLNDWSARDVQAFEYRPLGPFLGKSFATSLGPWIVTLDALEPYRCAAPIQTPPPLPHLAVHADGAYDIALEVAIATSAMRERGDAPHLVARTNARGLYWTIAQQLAHVASNGTRIRAGDVYGTGTISGATLDATGSLIERTRDGAQPLHFPDGSTRAFLEDGDEVVMRAVASRRGRARVGFGELRTIVRGS